MRICVIAVLLVACADLAAAEWYAPYITPQRRVAIEGGRALNLYCTGQGTPTVLFEGGATAPALTWRKVQAQIADAASVRVCAYDRAGMGFSDPGPMPRTARAQVEDLESLLRHADVRPPYVVVGASAGASNMRLFTDRNRDQVVGMVLVDPAIDDGAAKLGAVSSTFADLDAQEIARMRRCALDARAGKLTPGSAAQKDCDYWGGPEWPQPLTQWWQAEVASADYQAAVLSEAESSVASDAQLAASRRPWGALPLIVLTATGDHAAFGKQAPAVTAVIVDAHDDIAGLSTRGSRRTVADADHNIQSSRPQVVIDAVTETVAAARAAQR